MKNKARIALILVAACALGSIAHAQSTPPDVISGNAAPAVTSSPITQYEQFVIGPTAGPITLRHQGIYAGSETATLSGAPLRPHIDFTVDYVRGILSLIAPASQGQILRVSYQYDVSNRTFGMVGPQKLPTGPGLKGNFTEEYTAMPHLATATAFTGFSTNMSFGPVASQGLLLFTAGSPLTLGALDGKASALLGPADSQFLLQSLSANLLRGTVRFDFQNVGTSFSGFGQVKAAGYDQATVDQLQKEAGLRRMGFALNDLTVGGAKINEHFKTVSDSSGAVQWNTFSLESGSFKLSFDERHADSNFDRLPDLAESDKDALVKEAGLARQALNAAYQSKIGAFGFTSAQISDEFGQKINRNDFSFANKAFKLDAGEQSVGFAFSRFDSLTDPEKALYSDNQGTKRKWLDLETQPLGKGGKPIKLDLAETQTPSGTMRAQDASVGGKNWSLTYSDRKSGPQFGAQANLQDADVDKNVQAIATMYAPAGISTGPGDRATLMQGPGLDRSAFRLTAQPGKGASLDLEQVRLQGGTDYAALSTFALSFKNFDLTIHKEHEGASFTEEPLLFGFEQQRLGAIAGLDKLDLSLNWKLGGMKKLAFALMDGNTALGGAKRNSLDYSDKKIDLSFTQRSVDPGFTSAGQLSDPEAGLLAGILGFRETDFKANWQLSPKLSFQALWEDQKNQSANLNSFEHNLLMVWDPNKTMHLSYTLLDTLNDSGMDVLYRSRLATFLMSKDFGKYGKLQYVHQDAMADDQNGAPPAVAGQQAPPPNTALPLGSSSQDYLSYEATLSKTTSVKSEESETKYSNGTKESMSANTINQALTHNFGLSYTNLQMTGPDAKDEKKNNYGFWVDIGKGVRFSYGFVRDINPMAGNTSNSVIGITPGTLGPVKVDSATYGVNSWDQLHNQVTTNLKLESTKPVNFGFLKNLTFTGGLDTATDYSSWIRNNRIGSVSGKIGANAFMLEYKSQLDALGNLGTDKFVSFQTPSSPKNWISASIKIKDRQQPLVGTTMIRDYSITLRPLKNLEITNQLLTNPEEQVRPDVILGSVTSPWRDNKYKLDYHSSKSTTIGATWEDRMDDLTHAFYRTAGVDVELFKDSGSPLTLWYGMESGGGGTIPHQTAMRYYLKYYQKPGPNQAFSIFLGNISYDFANMAGLNRNNWSIHLDYELKLW